jgi:hypothetical protein
VQAPERLAHVLRASRLDEEAGSCRAGSQPTYTVAGQQLCRGGRARSMDQTGTVSQHAGACGAPGRTTSRAPASAGRPGPAGAPLLPPGASAGSPSSNSACPASCCSCTASAAERLLERSCGWLIARAGCARLRHLRPQARRR